MCAPLPPATPLWAVSLQLGCCSLVVGIVFVVLVVVRAHFAK